jgi:hypothetical protein
MFKTLILLSRFALTASLPQYALSQLTALAL